MQLLRQCCAGSSQLLRQCCAGCSQLLRQCCAGSSTERAMDRDSVFEVLRATMSADKQRKAKSFLNECFKQQGFTPDLLHIICDRSVPELIRLSAAVCFKNNVHGHWEVTDDYADDSTDDFYSKPKKDTDPERRLSDEDKALIREHIIDAVCAADEPYRTHLCTTILLILHADFPKNWPDFAEKLTAKIRQAPNASTLAVALLIVHRFLKVHQNNWLKDKDVIVVPFSKIEPAVSHRCFELLDLQSAEAVSVQIQGLKIVCLRTEFSNNFHMFPLSNLYEWIKFAIAILNRSCPEELDSIEDEEELSHTVWWKCKKWAAKLLGRLFQRCRYPHYAENQYVFTARNFLTEWAPLAIESSLLIFNAVRNDEYVSDRVLSFILSFTNDAIALSACWKVVKPHALELIEHVLFPILCYDDVAEDAWREDVGEPIRFRFAAFKDLLYVAHDAGKLLIGLARTSDVAESIFLFVVQVLSCSVNSREIEGAFRVLGELHEHLTRNKKCEHNVEQMLKTFVIGHLRHPSKFVRARAAWCIKQYSETCLFQTDALAKIIDSLVHRLGDQNERILVKVESALTIQCLLKHQEKVHALMRPSVGAVIVKVLELLAKTKIMAVIDVVDELLEQYNEDIIPIASEVAEHLCHIYLELLGTFTFGESPAHIFFGIPNTFRKIISKGDMVTLVKVEGSVVKVVDAMLETAPTFYREALRLLQSILHSYVSDPLWGVLDNLYDVFKEHNGIYVLPSFELGQVLHLYIVTHTESFLAFPHRVAVVLDMCITTMKTDSAKDERRLYATKIMECILLECSSHTTEVIPTILMTMFERLTKPFEEGMNLKPHVILVVVAALYMNLDVSLQVLHRIAPDHSSLLEYICDEFFTCYKKMKGIHDKRMAIIGICLYFQLPPPLRPSLISTNPKKVLEVSLSIFEKLLQERKLVAQKKNEESETDDSGEESNDEVDRKVPKIGQCHRKVHETEHLSDEVDEIDKVTLDHMDTAVKGDSRADRDDEDGDLDSATESLPFEEEKEIETFTTKFDGENGPDVFAFFKRTMKEFERNEPELYLKMVGNLSPSVAKTFQNLIKECEQLAKS